MSAMPHESTSFVAAPAWSRVKGRTIVVGLGRTGMSCVRFLHARDVPFAVTDSRAAPPEAAALRELAPKSEVAFGGFDERLLDGAGQLLVSPGVAVTEPFVAKAAARGLPIIGDIEIFAQEARAPIAAITGTNGKSTVTTLVAHMANACGRRAIAGGNLGRPALELLQDEVPELYVLELSSFQLETTHSLRAAAATVLNVTSDHMDRYAGMQQYADSKARIFARAQAAVINLDDPFVRRMPPLHTRVISFSLSDAMANYSVRGRGGEVELMRHSEPLIRMSELKIAGLHNAANALASLAMCEAMDLPLAPGVDALRTFGGLPHRSQWVAEVAGVRYIDDSKGTNVGATVAAVAGMPGNLVLIAGGQGKGQDFAPLTDALKGKVRHAVLIGQDAKLVAQALESIATYEFAIDMHDAVRRASQAARPGDTVLLSPACASLDMFRDYAHRGDEFAREVRGLQS